MKTCTRCDKEKNETEFYLSGRFRKDGTQGRVAECKVCVINRTGIHNKLHPEKNRKASRKHYYSHLESERKRGKEVKARERLTNRFNLVLRDLRKYAKRLGYLPCFATPEELEAAFTGKCHACGKTEEDNGRYLCVDHNHETGEFRGWLCIACNTADVLAGVVVC